MTETGTILLSLLSSGLLSLGTTAVLVWLSKTWISERLKAAIKSEYDDKLQTAKHQLELALEEKKAQLAVTNTTETERLKASLQIQATEHATRYERLHQAQAETVAQTYALLYRYGSVVEQYVKPLTTVLDASLEERRKAIPAIMKELDDYYRPRRIYFRREIAAAIDEYKDKLYKVSMDFMYKVEQGGGKVSDWHDIFEELRSDGKRLFDTIEEEFRIILGHGNLT